MMNEKLLKLINVKIKYYIKQMIREEYQIKITLYDEFIHELEELKQVVNKK